MLSRFPSLTCRECFGRCEGIVSRSKKGTYLGSKEPQNLNERKFVLFFGSCTQGIFTSTAGVLKLGSGILESEVLVSWGPANRACHPLGFNELLVVH